MHFYTAHLRDSAAPMLVREGFSWGALIFGPIWLAAHRAWIPAALSLAAAILILALTSGIITAVLMTALAFLLGLSGQDLRRWSIRHRGYLLAQVVAAHNESEALARLLSRRSDLTSRFLPAGSAR